MFDAINRLLHEMSGKLYHPVKIKQQHQYHEKRVQKIGYHGAMGASIGYNDGADNRCIIF